jgi:anion-transporting  ArsA/GET3 family ATPase
MSVLETLRTLELLRSQSLAVGAIVVNQLQPDSSGCSHCQRRRTIHQAELDKLIRRVDPVPVRVVESLASEIRGQQALADMATRLWGA